MLEPWEARVESRTPGPREVHVESWAPRGAQLKVWVPRGARWRLTKHVMKKPRRVTWLNRPGWWSDCQHCSTCGPRCCSQTASNGVARWRWMRGWTAQEGSRTASGSRAWWRRRCGWTARRGGRTASQRWVHGRTARGDGQIMSILVEREPWGGTGSGAGMGVALQELSYRMLSKSSVRWGETVKGNSVSSKTTSRDTMMLLVERSRHR
jgi:hypothetical protein